MAENANPTGEGNLVGVREVGGFWIPISCANGQETGFLPNFLPSEQN